MVDFNNEATVTTPSWELLKVLALEKRENVILGVEFYYKNKYTDMTSGSEAGILKARLLALYYELEAWLQRSKKGVLNEKKESVLVQLLKDIKSDSIEDNLAALSFLNGFMDEMGLLKIDTKRKYNKFRVEEENAEKDL